MTMSSTQDDLTEIMRKMDEPVQAWYNEETQYSFDPEDIKPFKFDSSCGHYTQVAWAESGELGCGQVLYREGSWYNTIVVCNYAEGGNMEGAAMYEEGEPCSRCSLGYSCEDSLCVKN